MSIEARADKRGRVGSKILVSTLRDASKRLGGWWTYDGNSDPDLHLLLHEAADEITRLRTTLAHIEHWPFDVGHTPERDLREIKEAAHDALA